MCVCVLGGGCVCVSLLYKLVFVYYRIKSKKQQLYTTYLVLFFSVLLLFRCVWYAYITKGQAYFGEILQKPCIKVENLKKKVEGSAKF